MKKYQKIAITAGTLLLIPFGAYAQDTGTTQTPPRSPEEIRREMEEKREEIKKEREEKRTELEAQREERKNEFEQKREEIKASFEAKKESLKNEIEERKEAVNEKVKDRLDKFVDKLLERFNAAQERLNELASRLDSRISKMESEGIDVSAQKTALANAKTMILALDESFKELETMGDEVVVGDTRALYPELKDMVEATKDEIKAAHKALIEIVVSLKGMSQKPKQTE